MGEREREGRKERDGGKGKKGKGRIEGVRRKGEEGKEDGERADDMLFER